jgi:hypothetical protein
MGLRPTYFRKIEDQEKFVDSPLKMDDNKNVIGCYLQGDQKILFIHNWMDYCTNLIPINNLEYKRSFV